MKHVQAVVSEKDLVAFKKWQKNQKKLEEQKVQQTKAQKAQELKEKAIYDYENHYRPVYNKLDRVMEQFRRSLEWYYDDCSNDKERMKDVSSLEDLIGKVALLKQQLEVIRFELMKDFTL